MDDDVSVINQKVAEALRILSEHCDSVQILLEYTEGDRCYRKFSGSGSVWGRQGLAQEFIDEHRARIHHHVKQTEFSD